MCIRDRLPGLCHCQWEPTREPSWLEACSLIAGGMYGAELTNAPGNLRKRVRTAVTRAISGKAL
eukprot:10223760-Heterocapsa_arctica.AAC.1